MRVQIVSLPRIRVLNSVDFPLEGSDRDVPSFEAVEACADPHTSSKHVISAVGFSHSCSVIR